MYLVPLSIRNNDWNHGPSLIWNELMLDVLAQVNNRKAHASAKLNVLEQGIITRLQECVANYLHQRPYPAVERQDETRGYLWHI
jgi:hypothetical protein